jgi:hypothetical protein
MRRTLCALTAVMLLSTTGCGLTMPTDPDGTLDSVRGEVLHVGISANGGLTVVDDEGDHTGSEVEAVEGFAEHLDARIDWTVGSEEATPWAEHAGMTRPYTEVDGADGTTHKLVMLVPMGENAFLTELETFLAGYTGETS